MASVLVAGHVNWDVTLVVDRLPGADEEASIRDRHRAGGGSAANVATALAGLDLDARLLGSVGDDELGRGVRDRLAEHGVDVDPVTAVPGATSTKYLLVAGDEVAMLGNDGANEAIGPDDVDSGVVADVDHVHITGQRADTAERLAELAVDAGCSVSLDPGRRAGDRALDGVAAQADVVFGTDREIAALYGDESPEPAHAREQERLVVATSGAGGARCVRGDEERTHSGFDVDVADTSGAGDAFVAGFLSVWLDDPTDLEGALAVGNACGAIASRRIGAQTNVDPEAVATLWDPTA